MLLVILPKHRLIQLQQLSRWLIVKTVLINVKFQRQWRSNGAVLQVTPVFTINLPLKSTTHCQHYWQEVREEL